MKVKILPIFTIGLTSIITKVNGDINFDDKIDELKKQGLDIKVDEIKEKVYSYDELESKRENEKYRRNDELNRVINLIGNYNQKNKLNDNINEEIKRKNFAIDKFNDDVVKDNERLLRKWNNKNKEISDYNRAKTSEIKEINDSNARLNDELKRDYDAKKLKLDKDKIEYNNDKSKIDKEFEALNNKIKKENEECVRLVNEENEKRKLKHSNEVSRIDSEYSIAVSKYNNDKSRIEVENANILKSNKEKEEKYRSAIDKYNKVLSDNKLKKEEYEKELNKINEENKKKEVENNKKNEEYNRLKNNNDSEIKKEDELIISSGGKRGEDVEKILPERLDVTASGRITLDGVNYFESINSSILKIKLPNSDINGGSYVDIRYERVDAPAFDGENIQIDGEVVGIMKLMSVDKKPEKYTREDSIEGYLNMSSYNYRLIFNDKISKYKNREINLTTNNGRSYNYFYGIDKEVSKALYVNNKVVVTGTHVIPKSPLKPKLDEVTADWPHARLYVDPSGELSIDLLHWTFLNSTPNIPNRTNKLEVGDYLKFSLGDNFPFKFVPDLVRGNFKDLIWNAPSNKGIIIIR